MGSSKPSPWQEYMDREGWIEYIAQGVITGVDAAKLVSAKIDAERRVSAMLAEALKHYPECICSSNYECRKCAALAAYDAQYAPPQEHANG